MFHFYVATVTGTFQFASAGTSMHSPFATEDSRGQTTFGSGASTITHHQSHPIPKLHIPAGQWAIQICKDK